MMQTNILPEINILFIGAQTEHIINCVFGLGSFLFTPTFLKKMGVGAKVDQKWLTLSPPPILTRGTDRGKSRKSEGLRRATFTPLNSPCDYLTGVNN